MFDTITNLKELDSKITLEQTSCFALLYNLCSIIQFLRRQRWQSRMLNESLSKHCEGIFPRQDNAKPLEEALQTTSASAFLRNLLCTTIYFYNTNISNLCQP